MNWQYSPSLLTSTSTLSGGQKSDLCDFEGPARAGLTGVVRGGHGFEDPRNGRETALLIAINEESEEEEEEDDCQC